MSMGDYHGDEQEMEAIEYAMYEQLQEVLAEECYEEIDF